MRLFKSILLFFCLLGSIVSQAGFDITPALVFVNGYRQHDSLGFNLVKDLPRLVYPQIIKGNIKLYATSKKEIRITPETLKSIEKNSDSKFENTSELFLNELWKLDGKIFHFKIIGFSFSSLKSNKKKISFGFIDINDVILLLKNELIINNANGTHSLTFYDALYSKKYNFSIVQFGNKNFEKNPKKSVKLKKKLFENPRITINKTKVSHEKLIQYHVFPVFNTGNEYTKKLFYKLENHFNTNKASYLNLLNIQDPVKAMEISKKNIAIEEIVVNEIWDKTNAKGPIAQKIQSVSLKINGTYYTLQEQELKDFNLFIDFKPLIDFILDKQFEFTLEKINQQPISPMGSKKYYKGLAKYPWNMTTIFVENID